MSESTLAPLISTRD